MSHANFIVKNILSLVLLSTFSSTIDIATGLEQDPYTSYFTGNKMDKEVQPTFGITMMGGRSEHDEAMKWFLQKANGGDILVLRASGSDGYNKYLFSELGITVNSVESIVIDNEEAAHHPYVVERIKKAEAIWMAGGNQWNYIHFWGNSPMKAALNAHISVKKGAIGGTSAGMAVLGDWYFSAQNGSITSEEALSNPYDEKVTLGNSFLNIQVLENTITDTHYANRNRQGRHTSFMAKIAQESAQQVYGIACDEYTAVCIDETGLARIFGHYPEKTEAVYFIQTSCIDNNSPEKLSQGEPLTWNRNKSALSVYKVIANESGTQTFNLNDWKTGNGGEWKHWYVQESKWQERPGSQPTCN